MCGDGWRVYGLHLGLVVPPECRLRVNEDTRHWQEGNVLIFDDTIEHETWNDSDQDLGNLLLDFLRLGITSFEADILLEEVHRYAESLARKLPKI